ncbi:MAG: segregation/condensation protein A [Saccharofermentans sp.]|nr:segregation/condensation protein A [Saccharofermentans sp.]
MSEAVAQPNLQIREFEGPLDLLYSLIVKNDIDIFDIPISEITEKYMEYLEHMKKLDMEIASEFIVMAATLIHIKSRIMLPSKQDLQGGDKEEDPREELVISLLRYRRCKMLAKELKKRNESYRDCVYRLPSTAKEMNVNIVYPPQEFVPEEFSVAIDNICKRNEVRFADISTKITHILKRDKLSVRERMKSVWLKIAGRGKMFFHELFEKGKADKTDRIVSFLAVLELLRSNRIDATQKKPFDVILIEEKGEGNINGAEG